MAYAAPTTHGRLVLQHCLQHIDTPLVNAPRTTACKSYRIAGRRLSTLLGLKEGGNTACHSCQSWVERQGSSIISGPDLQHRD